MINVLSEQSGWQVIKVIIYDVLEQLVIGIYRIFHFASIFPIYTMLCIIS